MNTVGAYLEGVLNEDQGREINMVVSEDVHVGSGACCKLVKTLHRLKLCGIVWYRKVMKLMKEMQSRQTNASKGILTNMDYAGKSKAIRFVVHLGIFAIGSLCTASLVF